jgi:hypothetical protein
MSTQPCMLAFARDLGEIASETSDPETAVKLIALANKVLAAAGYLPKALGDRSTDGNGEAR